MITPWLRLTQSLTISLCRVFNLNNKNVNALIAREVSGFTCARSLTKGYDGLQVSARVDSRLSKFQIREARNHI